MTWISEFNSYNIEITRNFVSNICDKVLRYFAGRIARAFGWVRSAGDYLGSSQVRTNEV